MTDSITLGYVLAAKQHERDKIAADVEEFKARGGVVEHLSQDAVSGMSAQEIFAGCRTLKRKEKK